MKYLPKETCEYLVSLGCTSESDWWENDGELYLKPELKLIPDYERRNEWLPMFTFEDILRKDNAEQIWPQLEGWTQWRLRTKQALIVFQSHPDTWPEEVAKLIKPND